jgi:hypothetical protein
MRLILGSTTAAAAATMIAVPATAANTFVNFDLMGGYETTVTKFASMSGTLTTMSVALDFETEGGGEESSWASDLLIGVTDSNGNSYEWGANDAGGTFGYTHVGDFPSSWESAFNGAYAFDFTGLAGLGLNGTGMWKFEFMNAWDYSNPNSHWDGELELVTEGVVPGVAGLAPFAGIVAIRRRRRR